MKIAIKCRKKGSLLGYFYIHTRLGELNIDPTTLNIGFSCKKCRGAHRLDMDSFEIVRDTRGAA